MDLDEMKTGYKKQTNKDKKAKLDDVRLDSAAAGE